jgi:hypothetical protein
VYGSKSGTALHDKLEKKTRPTSSNWDFRVRAFEESPSSWGVEGAEGFRSQTLDGLSFMNVGLIRRGCPVSDPFSCKCSKPKSLAKSLNPQVRRLQKLAIRA